MVANKDKGRFCIMAEIKYEVVERIAVLSQRPRGWERQLNLISWNACSVKSFLNNDRT